MKKYLAIAKATCQELLAYRSNLLLEVIGGIIAQLVIIAVWYTIFKDLGTETIGGFTLPEMMTYLLGAGIINSFILLDSQGDDINDDINRGNLSNFLVRPLNVSFYWLTRDFCRRMLTFFLGIGEYLILLLLFSEFLVPPASFLLLFLTLFSIILAGILHFLLFYILGVIAFWMDQTWGPRFVMRVIMAVATGSLIPLSLFPGIWHTIFNLLPFKLLVFVPLQIYLGKITTLEIVQEFAYGLVWILVVAGISVWLWKRGIKRYSAYGH